jgi:hypothetical protein
MSRSFTPVVSFVLARAPVVIVSLILAGVFILVETVTLVLNFILKGIFTRIRGTSTEENIKAKPKPRHCKAIEPRLQNSIGQGKGGEAKEFEDVSERDRQNGNNQTS